MRKSVTATRPCALDNVALDNIALDNIALDNVALDNVAPDNCNDHKPTAALRLPCSVGYLRYLLALARR